jgi:hypothetical protein
MAVDHQAAVGFRFGARDDDSGVTLVRPRLAPGLLYQGCGHVRYGLRRGRRSCYSARRRIALRLLTGSESSAPSNSSVWRISSRTAS